METVPATPLERVASGHLMFYQAVGPGFQTENHFSAEALSRRFPRVAALRPSLECHGDWFALYLSLRVSSDR